MTEYQEKAIAAIEAQQKGVPEYSAQWMVGEQLKDICFHEPRSAELIAQDLAVKEMSITEAEKKIKALADSRKRGNSSSVSPMEADRILREFYGLPEPGKDILGTSFGSAERPSRQSSTAPLRLEDFF